MKVLIIEDEPLIAQRLAREIHTFFGARVDQLWHGDAVDEAAALLQQDAVDLVLLDLNLHGEDGFRLLQLANLGRFRTIVVSAHAERALQAFDLGVLDFVAKPFSQPRLHKAFQRFADSAGQERVRALLVRRPGSVAQLPIDQIGHVQADGHYTQVQMCDGSAHFHDCALDKLMAILPLHFVRVHRSYAVNLQHVTRLRIAAGGKYLIDTRYAAAIPVSRTLYPQVRAALTLVDSG
jgi:two-component system response regulator LytT